MGSSLSTKGLCRFPKPPLLAYQASAYDGYGNGELEWFSHTDMDKNSVLDQVDKELIRSLCSSFLAFAWYTDNTV